MCDNRAQGLRFIIGCRGVVQLGGPDPWYLHVRNPSLSLSHYMYWVGEWTGPLAHLSPSST